MCECCECANVKPTLPQSDKDGAIDRETEAVPRPRIEPGCITDGAFARTFATADSREDVHDDWICKSFN